MFLKQLRVFIANIFLRPKISILIPFYSDNKDRKKAFKWVKRYWKYELPHAEVIVGRDRKWWECKHTVFCKNKALNDAVSRSRGKVLVIMDADAYIRGEYINRCADRILEELDNHLWYVPYNRLYRLNKEITNCILASNPECPVRIPSPPPNEWVENAGHSSKYGHRYGAMCMMFPREAYDTIGKFDERFKGWGGEDIALLRALDTLYGKHKITYNDILHLYHPFIGENYKTRKWEGQEKEGTNGWLANAYHKASRNPTAMRTLINKTI